MFGMALPARALAQYVCYAFHAANPRRGASP